MVEKIAEQLRQALEQLHPSAPWLALVVGSWAFVWFLRKHTPALWLWFEGFGPSNAKAARVFQALPSLLFGASVAAAGTGHDQTSAVMGALVAAIAPLLHHALKNGPVPYKGKVTRPNDKRGPPTGPTLLMILALALPSCSEARAVCYAENDAGFWRVVEACGVAGYDYDECPWIPEAERIQKAKDAVCP